MLTVVRVLSPIVGAANIISMFLATITVEPLLFLAGLFGAAFSFYGWLFVTEGARTMGDPPTGYLKLAMRLRWEIKEDMHPGQKLPATRELAEKHHTTRKTVLRAMHLLAQEGLVDVIHGRGCYVSGGRRDDRPGDRVAWHLLKLPAGEELPSTEDLTRACDANPGTVRRIVAELTRRGKVYRNQGHHYRT